MSISEQLLGAWELVSFVGTLPNGKEISPMGRGACGSIVYTPHYVSVNLARGNRERSEPEKAFHDLSDLAVGPLARASMAYSGPYKVNEEEAVVTHDFRFCLDPALIGTVQERHVRLFDDKLELSVRQATGVAFPAALLWRRVTN